MIEQAVLAGTRRSLAKPIQCEAGKAISGTVAIAILIILRPVLESVHITWRPAFALQSCHFVEIHFPIVVSLQSGGKVKKFYCAL